MNWQFYILLRILVAEMIKPVLTKKIANQESKTRRQYWIYVFTALLSAVYFLAGADYKLDSRVLAVAAIGLANSIGFYCHLRAQEISLSKTSVLTSGDDLTGLALGYVFLQELNVLTPVLVGGIALCFAAAILFAQYHQGIKLLAWIGGYSFVWGFAMFSMRYFGIEDLPRSHFLLGWYGGSLAGAGVLLLIFRKKAEADPIPKREIPKLLPVAGSIWLSLFLAYSAYKSLGGYITVVQPVVMVGELVFPTLIGLYWFKENRVLGRKEKAAMMLGAAGSLVIAFSS